MISSFMQTINARLGWLKAKGSTKTVDHRTYMWPSQHLVGLLTWLKSLKASVPNEQGRSMAFFFLMNQPQKLYETTSVILSWSKQSKHLSPTKIKGKVTHPPLSGRHTNIFAAMFSNTYSQSSVCCCLLHQYFELELLLINVCLQNINHKWLLLYFQTTSF